MSERTPDAEGDLQFERAEFGEPRTLACAACTCPIGDEYFDANGHIVCVPCRDRIVAGHAARSGPAGLLGAAVLGAGAAGVGAGVWHLVRVVTHLEIGLIAIGLGMLVGTAVRRGAGGRGGLAYQILAVLLTYLAIAGANTPYVWKGLRHSIATAIVSHAPALSIDSDEVRAKVDEVIPQLPAAMWASVAWTIVESPFLGGIENVIGLLILFFGLQQAWRLTRATPLQLTGPFAHADAPAPG